LEKLHCILRTERKVIKDTYSEITSSRAIQVSVKANLTQIKHFFNSHHSYAIPQN